MATSNQFQIKDNNKAIKKTKIIFFECKKEAKIQAGTAFQNNVFYTQYQHFKSVKKQGVFNQLGRTGFNYY